MEQNTNTCRALITTPSEPNKVRPDPSLSHFFCITISKPMVRIRIPKLLAKSMQKRSQNKCNSSNNRSTDFQDKDKKKNKKKKWANEIGEKVGSIFSSVFRSKRSHSVESKLQRNDIFCGRGDVATLSKSYSSVERNLEIEGEEEHGSNPRMEGSYIKPSKVQVCSLNKRKTLKFMRSKVSKNDQKKNGFSNVGCFCNCGRRKNRIRQKGTSRNSISSSSSKFSRIPSGFLTASPKLKVGRPMGKMANSQRITGRTSSSEDEEERREGDEELCKKKILLGGKCKPLNNTGILHYDEDGILLPDQFLP